MSQAADMVQLYIDAEIAVLEGKTFTRGEMSFTSEDLTSIRQGRREWEQRVLQERGTKRHSVARF